MLSCSKAGGAATKEEVVSAYVDALGQRNEEAVLALIPDTHDAKEAVRIKVEQFGGHPDGKASVEYRSDFGPDMAVAKIRLAFTDPQGDQLVSEDEINLRCIEGWWYLILGQYLQGLPADVTPTKP